VATAIPHIRVNAEKEAGNDKTRNSTAPSAEASCWRPRLYSTSPGFSVVARFLLSAAYSGTHPLQESPGMAGVRMEDVLA